MLCVLYLLCCVRFVKNSVDGCEGPIAANIVNIALSYPLVALLLCMDIQGITPIPHIIEVTAKCT